MPNPGLPHVKNCYGCSTNNSQGLNIKFSFFEDYVLGEFQSNQNHSGPPGIVHGGVLAAIMDESFSILCRGLLKKESRTIKEEITFRNPARLGDLLTIKTKLEEETHRVLLISSEVYSKDTLIANAKGTMFKLKVK